MSDFLTVKQFAEAANVSTQRIYQRLTKDLQPFCKTENGKKYLSVEALKLFGKEDLQSTYQGFTNDLPSTCKPLAKDLQSPLAKIEELTAENEGLNSEISALKEKVARLAKDLQKSENAISDLKADKEYLKSKLDAADTNISNLTAALAAAQALHGMDKQQAVIEVKADEAPEEDQTPEPPPQKLSFFQRLFGKRSE